MRRYEERKDKIESEALDGILLLKKEQVTKKQLLARLNGKGKKEWELNVYDNKFKIKDGKNIAIFFYFVLEKTWFVFLESGNLKVNSHQIRQSAVLRNEAVIEIGSLFFLFEIKFIVRKEYKKLLVEIILDSPNKKLSLSEIYDKLLKYYRFCHEKRASWKNSIRCVLSESKVFYKIAKEVKHGRGSYWSVCQAELLKMDEDSIRRCEKKHSDQFIFEEDCSVYEKYNLISEVSDFSSEELSDPIPFEPQRYNFNEPRYLGPNYYQFKENNENLVDHDPEDELEIASFDGRDSFIDELSSDMSCLSVKAKRRRRRR